MGGLNPSEEQTGFKKFTICPKPDKRIGYTDIRYDSPYGWIKVRWALTEDGMRLDVTIPFDTTAEIIIPDELCANQLIVNSLPMRHVLMTDRRMTLSAGTHQIIIR